MALDAVAQAVHRVFAQLPPDLGALPEDARSALKLALTRALRELDLVTREEFEVQQQVLAKTRQKLAALEARVAALEARMHPSDQDMLD
ncbi:MAG TPA: accessory factor UbiK family protein [Sulfurivirga caldicuralii]|nr:accessory factor UbiK family protein [Sulfurivirga caldicuralii]